MYGRTDAEWAALTDAGQQFLVERAKLQNTTTYTEMNTVLARRTGLREFDLEMESERKAMGELLGGITRKHQAELKEDPDTGIMLSAICKYLNENDAGRGFFELAVALGQMQRGASELDRLAFWSTKVDDVFGHYKRR